MEDDECTCKYCQALDEKLAEEKEKEKLFTEIFERALKELNENWDFSDPMWNDYDEHGVPYWEKRTVDE